jgi:hypothetical protein
VHVWRAREFDGSAWSGWTGSRAFTAQASISITLTTLGHADAARMSSGWDIGFGALLPGTSLEVGPAGSGQATPGAAIEYEVTSDGTTTTTAQGTDFADGANSIPIGQLQRRDRASGETIEELTWTPFTTTNQAIEQDGAGTTLHAWDLRLTVPGAQPSGSYAGSVAITTVANP